jgi:hypothetical protein
MGPHMYLYEKAREVHYQDLRRQVDKGQLLEQLPQYRRSMIQCAAGKLGMMLLKLGARLKQFEQSPTVLEDHL